MSHLLGFGLRALHAHLLQQHLCAVLLCLYLLHLELQIIAQSLPKYVTVIGVTRVALDHPCCLGYIDDSGDTLRIQMEHSLGVTGEDGLQTPT